MIHVARSTALGCSPAVVGVTNVSHFSIKRFSPISIECFPLLMALYFALGLISLPILFVVVVSLLAKWLPALREISVSKYCQWLRWVLSPPTSKICLGPTITEIFNFQSTNNVSKCGVFTNLVAGYTRLRILIAWNAMSPVNAVRGFYY